MRAFGGVFLVAACLVAGAFAHPGVPRATSSSEEGDAGQDAASGSAEGDGGQDTVLVLPRDPSRGVLGGGYPREFYGPDVSDNEESFYWPLSGLMNRIRQQLNNMLSFSYMPDFSHLPEGANVTSKVKVINGHVVTINETSYVTGDDMSSSVFRIRVIDVKPLNDTTLPPDDSSATDTPTLSSTPAEEEGTTSSDRSVETVEDLNNEIPKNEGNELQA